MFLCLCYESQLALPTSIRKHGRLLEEGASGFLAGKIAVEDGDSIQCHDKSWSSFNELIKSKEGAEKTFGSSDWASVYLASTPQEAEALGLQFPGVDEVPFLHISFSFCDATITTTTTTT